MRIVGIEEHVNRPSVMEQMTYLPDALRAKLLPSVEQRIADMDAAGISVEALSAPITAPGPDGAANPLAPVMPLDESAVPMMRIRDIYYTGAFSPAVSGLLGNAGYGWHCETSLHVIRLILSGVFDRIPGLKIIIGHLGEGLAFHLHRIDTQLNPLAGLPKPIIQYLTENIWYTTSGYFFDDQFALTRAMFGDDRVVFSVDYPFEDNRQAREWFNHLDLPGAVREKMAHGTADRLLRLPVSGNGHHNPRSLESSDCLLTLRS